MLFILIPSLLVVVGVAWAGRVIYKKLPKEIGEWDKPVAKADFGPAFYEKALAAFSLKSKQTALNLSTKLVYKLKITSLKTDNFFSRLLNEMKVHKSNVEETVKTASETRPENIETKNIKPFKTELTSLAEDEGIVAIKKKVSADYEAIQPEPEIKSAFERQEQQLVNQLAYNPKDVSAYKRLGWLYLENSKPMDARQAFKMAVKLGSKDKIIITKLLELGGVVHKEGIGLPKPVKEIKPVLAASASVVEVKPPKQKTRKLKVKKV